MRFPCNSFINKVAGLQSIDKFIENKVLEKDIFQQTFVCLQNMLQTSSRHCYDLVKLFLIKIK